MRPPTESSRPWWVLIGTCTGAFLVMLDAAVVALALPTIQRDLDASAATLQWVMNSYLLVTCVLVITVGRLGDMFGRRLMFVSALAVFAGGSLLAALAGDGTVLVVARSLQGVGGAALLSLSLALVSHAFPVDRQGHALGIWAASSAVALAIGPLVGGILIEADWRWIFSINLPVCAVGIGITLWAARESRDETSAPTLDYPGTLSLGLFAVVLALIDANTWGWGSPTTLIVLAVGALVLWASGASSTALAREDLGWRAVLQGDRGGHGEHGQAAAQGRAFFADVVYEQLAERAVLVGVGGQVALEAGDRELVRDAAAGGGQAPARTR